MGVSFASSFEGSRQRIWIPKICWQCIWGQQARGNNYITCRNLLAEDHTNGALASYVVAASSFLPPFAITSKLFADLITGIKLASKAKPVEPNQPGTGEVIQAAGAGEDKEANLGVAKDGKLVGLLEQPTPPLRERHLPARRVFDPL
ncbi:hypothetical protein ACP70R_047610 [Stipagrostis hirtigluma subsp. patula]